MLLRNNNITMQSATSQEVCTVLSLADQQFKQADRF